MRKSFGIVFGQGLAIALMVGFLTSFSPIVFVPGQAFADGSDNFDGATIDLTKWAGYDPTEKKGQGQISQVNGHLEYTTSGSGSGTNSYDHKWIATQFPYNGNWSIELSVVNKTTPTVNGDFSSFGINIRNADETKEIEVEHAASMDNNIGSLYCHSELHTDSDVIYDGLLNPFFNTNVRVSFDGTTKIFTVWCGSGGPVESFGSFGISASGGGTTGNVDWGLSESDMFKAYVFGYSENMEIFAGDLFGDNFTEYGGIVPPPPVLSASIGSVGSVVTIDGSGFGDSKGSVSIGDAATQMGALAADTVSAPAAVKPAKTKVASWNDSSISFTLSKALPPGTYDVIINPKVKPPEPIVMYDAFTVTSPVIISMPDGGAPEQEITIEGSFFGTKKGKVYLEYTDGTNIKKKTCKVTEWSMYDLANGGSRIKFMVPKLSKTFTGGDCTLKVVNKIGYAERLFSVGMVSDRNLKENVAPIDGREVLTRLAGLPVSVWNYKGQGSSIRHIGPMAQDFKAAFSVGESDRFISMVDSGGVALASIQGLYSILQEKDKEIRDLRKENTELKDEIRDIGKRLAVIEHLTGQD